MGANIEEEFEVADEGFNADSVLRAMQDADNRLNIIILDACRNNPFARSFRSATRGLARMTAPTGSLVAYATAPGKVAADGDGRNGIYTRHLLDVMQEPGRTLEQVFKQVRILVERETAGRQIPWEESSLTGDFYFRHGTTVAVTPTAEPPFSTEAHREQFVWQGIAGSDNPGDFEQFLRDFPEGNFAAFARNRLVALQDQQASPGGSGSMPALASAGQDPENIVYLTGHGELIKAHGTMNADQHYQHVADAITNYFNRRQLQISDQGVLPGGRAALQARLGTLQGTGNPLLYLTVVGATRPMNSRRDVVTLECYTSDNKLQWTQKETNFWASSREESLTKAALKLEKSLEKRFGSACLQ